MAAFTDFRELDRDLYRVAWPACTAKSISLGSREREFRISLLKLITASVAPIMSFISSTN